MKKRRVELFQFNDFETISQHLSRMAEKGWMLEETGSFFWTVQENTACPGTPCCLTARSVSPIWRTAR